MTGVPRSNLEYVIGISPFFSGQHAVRNFFSKMGNIAYLLSSYVYFDKKAAIWVTENWEKNPISKKWGTQRTKSMVYSLLEAGVTLGSSAQDPVDKLL